MNLNDIRDNKQAVKVRKRVITSTVITIESDELVKDIS